MDAGVAASVVPAKCACASFALEVLGALPVKPAVELLPLESACAVYGLEEMPSLERSHQA